MARRVNKGLFSSAKPDWETPWPIFQIYNAKYNFTLDVCASDTNHKLPQYFTKDTDGLARSWRGHRCWMNPPYGKEIKDWVKKAAEEANDEHTFIVGLLPSRTDTQWWHKYIIGRAASVEFLKGRIKFVGGANSAPFPSAVVIWGNP